MLDLQIAIIAPWCSIFMQLFPNLGHMGVRMVKYWCRGWTLSSNPFALNNFNTYNFPDLMIFCCELQLNNILNADNQIKSSPKVGSVSLESVFLRFALCFLVGRLP